MAVGLIGLAGLDAQTGVVMLLSLTLAHGRRVADGSMRGADLEDAIVEGAARRIRPKPMTVVAMPWAPAGQPSRVGSEPMKSIFPSGTPLCRRMA